MGSEYDIVRIAKLRKPLILLLENVRNILSVDNGEVIRAIKRSLEAIGYRGYSEALTCENKRNLQ